MYKNKLAVAIKHNGKILRETKDLVKLPFGSEFSVLVKNLNSRRAKFILHIDGQDVLGGTEVIVNANSEIEMKRFIRNGNMNEGNAFKFIERTQTIEDGPRGIKVDDGVIRVEFWFEQEKSKEVVKTIYHETHYYRDRCGWGYGPLLPHYGPNYYGPYYNAISSAALPTDNISSTDNAVKGMLRSTTAVAQNASINNVYGDCTLTNSATTSTTSLSAEVNEAGITVPGSKVDQKFTPVYGFTPETESHVIILRMIGQVGDIEIAKAITVKNKPKCETCGKLNKATSSFCSSCGTSLNLF